MGCDIHGYVEINHYGWWRETINIGALLGRNYDMFALLFGVRNDASFLPIAPDRGIPDFASDTVKEEVKEWGEDGHSHSWIAYEEIAAIDWNTRGTQLADRIFCYKQEEDEKPCSSFGMASWLNDEDCHLLNAGHTIRRFDPFEECKVYLKREVQKAADSLSSDWKCLFALMQHLNEYLRAGEKQVVESSAVPATRESVAAESLVRLVVWFDN